MCANVDTAIRGWFGLIVYVGEHLCGSLSISNYMVEQASPVHQSSLARCVISAEDDEAQADFTSVILCTLLVVCAKVEKWSGRELWWRSLHSDVEQLLQKYKVLKEFANQN